MRVDVDEAGRYQQSARVDLLPCTPELPANRDNFAVAYSDVRLTHWRPGAVGYCSALDQKIKLRGHSLPIVCHARPERRI